MTKIKNAHLTQFIIAATIIALTLIGTATYVAMQWVSRSSMSSENLGMCKEWEVRRICTGRFVGLSKTDAAKVAEEYNLEHRIVKEDKKSFANSADYRPNRINLSIENGIVTHADFD